MGVKQGVFSIFKIQISKFRISVTFSLFKDSALIRSDDAISIKSTLRKGIFLSEYKKVAKFEG